MARGTKQEDQVTTEENKEQLNEMQASNDEEQVITAPPVPVEVVLLKNIRHATGVRRKGDKFAVSVEESDRLINAKLARLPE
jgi:hypothetical protein